MKNKPSFIIGIILFLSLSANFFLLGLNFGGGSQDKNKKYYSHQQDTELRKRLPEADKKILKEAMENGKAELSSRKTEYLKAKTNARKLMQSDEIDLDAIEKAILLENDKKIELMSFMNQLKIKASKELSKDGLKALSNMRKHGIMSDDKRKHKKYGQDRIREAREKKNKNKKIKE